MSGVGDLKKKTESFENNNIFFNIFKRISEGLYDSVLQDSVTAIISIFGELSKDMKKKDYSHHESWLLSLYINIYISML